MWFINIMIQTRVCLKPILTQAGQVIVYTDIVYTEYWYSVYWYSVYWYSV